MIIPIAESGSITSNKKWYSRFPNNPISKNVIKNVETRMDTCFLLRLIFVIYKNPPIAGRIPNIGNNGIIDKVS